MRKEFLLFGIAGLLAVLVSTVFVMVVRPVMPIAPPSPPILEVTHYVLEIPGGLDGIPSTFKPGMEPPEDTRLLWGKVLVLRIEGDSTGAVFLEATVTGRTLVTRGGGSVMEKDGNYRRDPTRVVTVETRPDSRVYVLTQDQATAWVRDGGSRGEWRILYDGELAKRFPATVAP